jgi:ATP-binding cassette subfamily B protein
MSRLFRSAEWRFFGAVYRASPGLAVAWWSLVTLRGLLPAAFAVLMGVLIGTIQRGEPLGLPLAEVGVVFVAMQALGPFHDAVSSNLGARATSWLHDRLLEATTSPSGLAHLEDPELADQLSAAREFDLGITGPNIIVSMPNIGGGFALFAGGLAQALLLFAYHWWAPLVVGGVWLSTHYFLAQTAIWRERTSDEVLEKQRKADYAYRIAVNPPAAKEVRLFGLGDWLLSGFTSLRRHLVELSWNDRRLKWRPTLTSILLIVCAYILFFWILASDAAAGLVSLPQLVVFAQAAIGVGGMAFGEFDWWLRTAAQPVPLVLDFVKRIGSVGLVPSGDRSVDGIPAREIRFESVDFSYPHSDRSVLNGFDLTIPAGRSLAIVGQNGAGKTTLAKLICRFYDPRRGAITVDGIDLREIETKAWRSRIAAVFQDFVRYELSLAENVAPAGASDRDVEASLETARASGLADLTTTLSRGYEGGTDLSGGQWQRVALARALCAVRLGAGVVILDEPTAQLDVRGEAEIFERLLEATRGVTTILISHRFSTVRRADLICVLEHGRVVEKGTHDQLMALEGRYRTMFELQASRFFVESEEELEHLEPVE